MTKLFFFFLRRMLSGCLTCNVDHRMVLVDLVYLTKLGPYSPNALISWPCGPLLSAEAWIQQLQRPLLHHDCKLSLIIEASFCFSNENDQFVALPLRFRWCGIHAGRKFVSCETSWVCSWYTPTYTVVWRCSLGEQLYDWTRKTTTCVACLCTACCPSVGILNFTVEVIPVSLIISRTTDKLAS
jgi:hypothetical protein